MFCIPQGMPVAATEDKQGPALSRTPGVGFATRHWVCMGAKMKSAAFLVGGAIAICSYAGIVNTEFYCRYCGRKASDVRSLTSSSCQRHPDGPAKGRHALYEGGVKDRYVCKYCGHKATTINSLTSSKCQRHPKGAAKGLHEPAL